MLTATCLPLPEAPPKPKNNVPDSQPVPVHESTYALMQAKCQGTCLKTGTGYSYLSNDNENKTENEPKNTASVTSPRPPIKEEELRTNDQATEKCGWDQIAPSSRIWKRKTGMANIMPSYRRQHSNQNYKNHKPEGQYLRPKLEYDLNINVILTENYK